MARKNRGSQQVVMRKSEKDRNRMVITAAQIRQGQRAAEREARKEAGDVMGRAGRGGAHGGDKRDFARRDRQAGRQAVRRFAKGDYGD